MTNTYDRRLVVAKAVDYSRLAVLGEMTLLVVAAAVFLGRARGTTLLSAGLWSAIAVLAAGLVFAARGSEVQAYCSWCLTFCPALAVLGAKRPQHLGWNAVVLALAGLLVYPAVQSAIMRPGDKLALGNIWPWFLLVMIFVTPAAYVATRYFAATSLIAVAQAVFFLPYLPLAAGYGERWELRTPVAYSLLLLAAIVAEFSYRNRRETWHPADAIWLDFRDTFGIFWGLRFAERINDATQRFGWPVRLEWGGFVVVPHDSPLALNDALDQALAAELRPTMRGLLRRFVDQAWIDRRLKTTGGETQDEEPR